MPSTACAGRYVRSLLRLDRRCERGEANILTAAPDTGRNLAGLTVVKSGVLVRGTRARGKTTERPPSTGQAPRDPRGRGRAGEGGGTSGQWRSGPRARPKRRSVRNPRSRPFSEYLSRLLGVTDLIARVETAMVTQVACRSKSCRELPPGRATMALRRRKGLR